MSLPVSPSPSESPALSLARDVDGVSLRDRAFSEMTTLRVGGSPAATLECATSTALARTVRGLDRAGVPLLVVGGGSNLVVGDDVSGLVAVVPVAGTPPSVVGVDAGGEVVVRAAAGTVWDDLVAWTVAQGDAGYGGLECLSGIPGTVGAAPVQNIGAYGAEVSRCLHRVQLLDRSTGELAWVEPGSLDLAYRYSNLKFTARGVVTAVEFRLTTDGLSAPLRFGELARRLGVSEKEPAPRRPVRNVREAVLELRRGKGMVLDPADHDTWSAGSFFTNPVVEGEDARDAVAAKVTARCGAAVAGSMPCYPVTVPSGPRDGGAGGTDGGEAAPAFKFSAAWLIEHAGFPKGWQVPAAQGGTGRAGLSTKHTLALTNRGGASCSDIVALAVAVRDGVREAFGVSLVPEPVWVGVTLPE
ncbi:UDP-N-acetylmuramate dehydrogenase [Corynebacterium provencense]|uniref:UDP-N-acetylmuramate dehydrogenase n=1 Tax=Corynebacterium provencense TaxID=1737425 RepID=UPI000AF3978D